MRRRRAAGGSTVLATLLALALGACTSPVSTPGAAPTATPETTPAGQDARGTLRVALGSDPVSIDPGFVVDDEGALVVDALFDPLVRLDDRLRVVPAAATSWETSEDGRTLTFTLRRARFHDGSPVTADDFVRGFRRLADPTAVPPSPLGYLVEPVLRGPGGELTGVEAVDERTLRIRLTEPRPGYLRTLTDPSLAPIPDVADLDPDGFAEQPVGNGPFAMAEPRERDAFLRLSRHAAHPTPPRLDEVVFLVYGDDPTRDRRWEDLLAGQVQVTHLAPDRVEEAVERFGVSVDGYRGPGVLDGLTTTTYLYGFDTTTPPFDDVRIRRAISLSIDREALAERVFRSTRVAADGLIPPPVVGSQAGACDHCRHDPVEARRLLDEVRADQVPPLEPDPADGEVDTTAGPDAQDADATESDAAAEDEAAEDDAAEDGAAGDDAVGPPDPVLERLTLTHPRGRTHAAVAEHLAADIERALRIEVELAARDLPTLLQSVAAGEVPVFRLGWDPGVSDATGYLTPLFHSDHLGAENVTRYRDAEVDALLEQAAASPTTAGAIARTRAAERQILAAAPVVPLLWYRHTAVVSPEVRDLVWSPLGRIDLARVWLARDGE